MNFMCYLKFITYNYIYKMNFINNRAHEVFKNIINDNVIISIILELSIFAKKNTFPTSNDITSGLLVHSWRTQKKREREKELVFKNKKKVEKTKDVINFD